MKRLVLFLGILVTASVITGVLKAQREAPIEKKYSVSLTLNEWIVVNQKLEYIKGQLRQSDLPSKNVAYLSDSLITPLQSIIGLQVNAQIEAEKPKPETKKDSTKPKSK